MHFQHSQHNVVKADLEEGGLMKGLIGGVVHTAGLVQVRTESGLV